MYFIVWNACSVSHSGMSDSLRPHRQCSPQALLSIAFSRKESSSGWSFHSPGNLPDTDIELRSLAGRFFTI